MPCPLRIDANDSRGCCRWSKFAADFEEYWQKWFDAPPTVKHWQSAKRDWLRGNTGWEAAHNAQRRAKERIARNL